MMTKKNILIIGLFIILLLNLLSVSAICCEKLKGSDMWCQSATSESQCDSGYTKWIYKETCSFVPECSGTCVNAESGECSQYTPKAQCIKSGGAWSEKDISEIPACNEVCCLIGQDAYFVNPTECKNLFTQYGIQGTVRTDITSRLECQATQMTLKTGACVISTNNEKACKITTNADCTNEKINELSQYLKNPSLTSQIEVRFYENLLCTASLNGVGISDCAKSQNTVCENNKVYYVDLCGNLANIYDSSKYNNADYWTYLKKEYDNSLCNVSSSGSNSCGNCDTTVNTVCQNYKDAEIVKPQNNEDGLVCGSLTCKYQGKTYQHGESWCAGTAGTLIVDRNLTTGEIFKDDLTALKNASKYNIPGSRYYKLVCSFGEVIVEECGDYRNSICMQGKDDTSQRSAASCVSNTWRNCLQIETRTACENTNLLCKWIPGYRWDYQIVEEKDRKEFQGSCVPLVAPGFDFWEANSQGNPICGAGNAQESVFFEFHWMTNRDKIDEWSKQLANRCLNGCYAIPQYGKEFNQRTGEEKQYPEEISCGGEGRTECYGISSSCSPYDYLTEFYDESGCALQGGMENYYLSDRRGQYCHKDGEPDKWLTGEVSGTSYDCTPGAGGAEKDEEKERDYPIYLTNDEWVRSITDRAKSLGDCGYKVSINGKYSKPESEIITAIFQKLKQDGNVKKNITVEQIIYKGNAYLKGSLEKYETELPASSSVSYSCAPDYKGVCTSLVNNAEPCSGGQTSEGTCPANMVCCVYPELS